MSGNGFLDMAAAKARGEAMRSAWAAEVAQLVEDGLGGLRIIDDSADQSDGARHAKSCVCCRDCQNRRALRQQQEVFRGLQQILASVQTIVDQLGAGCPCCDTKDVGRRTQPLSQMRDNCPCPSQKTPSPLTSEIGSSADSSTDHGLSGGSE